MSDRFGLLFDFRFYHDITTCKDALDFLEVVPDRFSSITHPSTIPEFWAAIPTVFHSLNFSIGSDDPLDRRYLKKISALTKRMSPDVDKRSSRCHTSRPDPIGPSFAN